MISRLLHYFCVSGNVYALRVNLSVAIVAMNKPYNKTVNGTEVTVSTEGYSSLSSMQITKF